MHNNYLRRVRTYARKVALGVGTAGAFIILTGISPVSAATGETCAACHETAVAEFNTSYHARIWQGANDCQSCHGNADQHLSEPSKQAIVSFSKDGGRSAEELSAQCLKCHSASPHLSLWDMGEHSRNDVTCISCHDIHTQRSAVQQPTVCFTCHRDVRSDANKISHHPLIEGKVSCGDCHNPHGTTTPGMINAENTNQLCYQCHADKRGPWIWEHPPVEENCAICHTPHGSRHENLMVEKVTNLCQDCHDDGSHHSAAYDAQTGFGGANESNRFLGRSCVECHHAIHGSANFRRSFSR